MLSLRPFPLELHFLNEAIASTDSGESVFSTRALRVIKFSELIFKMKSNREQRKVCHPFPDEVSDSICMKTSFKNMGDQTHLNLYQNNFKYIMH